MQVFLTAFRPGPGNKIVEKRDIGSAVEHAAAVVLTFPGEDRAGKKLPEFLPGWTETGCPS